MDKKKINHIAEVMPSCVDFEHSMAASPISDLKIRSSTSADWDRMAHIYNEAIHSGRSTMDQHPVNAEYFKTLTDNFTSRECTLVASLGTQLAVWGIVKKYSDRPGYALACETSVYVAEDYQGQGLGRALQHAIIQKAWEFGYRHLVAKILAVNQVSVRFHRHFGYHIAGIQTKIGFINGIWHDVVIMQRILTDTQPKENSL